MNKLGLPSFITYLPFNEATTTPQAYKRYLTPVSRYEDVPRNMIIFPEVYPYLASKVKLAQPAIWWLSLENFLERRHIWPLHDKIRYIKRVIKGQRPLNGARSLTNMVHFSQTEHATAYLKSCGIDPVPLIDSINEDFLTDKNLNFIGNKEDVILYNPTKGRKTTDKLIQANPQWKFIPLHGLNRDQLTDKLSAAKLYIDFGHHPGRDRMPREAAMQGCCLITGILGSAGNDVDLPIPRKYKLDSSLPEFTSIFKALAQDVFSDFESHNQNFEKYRQYLKREPEIFRQQIANYFIKK
ncbi:hypothetical protein A1332_15980 [Methylomonas methanica]|uniref:Uncharacterized protein n=2 Tax=Methylomonas methanica TaxID=421 RepID=A0A177MDC5_METMH|nr:hypothetical protein A1332_15980 [Methylomonas methanica]